MAKIDQPTFRVPSDAVRISFTVNALKEAFSLNIFLKSLFKPVEKMT